MLRFAIAVFLGLALFTAAPASADRAKNLVAGTYCVHTAAADGGGPAVFLSDWFPEHYYHCSTGEIWDITTTAHGTYCIKNRYLNKYLSGVVNSQGKLFADSCDENSEFHVWVFGRQHPGRFETQGYCVENIKYGRWLTRAHGYSHDCDLKNLWHFEPK